jgi:hypothetical protein
VRRARLTVLVLLACAAPAACASEAGAPEQTREPPREPADQGAFVAPDEADVVAALAESFAADGTLTADQAACVARAVTDAVGLDRLAEITSESEDFTGATPEQQQEMTRAVLDATTTCGIPLGVLSGG